MNRPDPEYQAVVRRATEKACLDAPKYGTTGNGDAVSRVASIRPAVTAISRRAKVLLLLSAMGAALPLAVGLPSSAPPTVAWLLDLAVHWQWTYLIVGAACATWLIAVGSYAWALPGMLVLAGGWFLASPEIYAAASRPAQTLTVVTANLNAENEDSSTLHRWVQALDADVLVVEEVTPRTAATLERWEDYPHRVLQPQEGPFGLAVLSRHPLEAVEVREPAGQTLHVRTHVRWGETRFALAAVHPMPPVSAEYHARRVELFEAESLWASGTRLPAVVAGDLNASPWSSAVRPFTAHGLHRATGLTPTWPAIFPLIPIDQVVVSAHWRVVDSGVGPRVGSDHRPAYVRLTSAAR